MSPSQDVKAVLVEHLKELHLPAMREAFEAAAQQAQREALSYEQYLLELTERECQTRRQNRIERQRRQSRLPLEKTLASFDLKRLPAKLRQQVRTLLEGSFLDRRENLLAFGNPGSGKTHLACAIGLELIQAGRSVYFTPTSLLVQDLLIAKRDLKLSRVLKRLAVRGADPGRLVHHSVILELNLPSYRMEAAKKAKADRKTASDVAAGG